MDTHYPFIEYTLDALGDRIQKGQINWFVTLLGQLLLIITQILD